MPDLQLISIQHIYIYIYNSSFSTGVFRAEEERQSNQSAALVPSFAHTPRDMDLR